MKKIISLLMVTLILNLSITGIFAQQPTKAVLKRGTHVSVQLTSQASSNKNNTVTAIIASDVRDQSGEWILLKRETPVTLTVERVKSKGMGKGGSLNITAMSTIATDGSTVNLLGNTVKEGDDSSTALVLGLTMGIIVLPVVGFFFFCLKGEKVVMPANTILPNIIVSEDYQVAL